MITAVRVEGIGGSPAELQAELDAVLGHFCMAGYLEGVVPQASEIADEVYPRRPSEQPWKSPGGREFWLSFEGRKVLRFEPNEGWDMQRPVEQVEYRVIDRGFEPVPAEVQFTGDVTRAEGTALMAEPIYRDVSAETIVLRRQLPMDWPDSVRDVPYPPELLTQSAPKLTPLDLQRYAELVLRHEVEEASYAVKPNGYTVEVSCVVPTSAAGRQAGVNAMGWRSHFFAETLGDASVAAGADIDARIAEMDSVPGKVTGRVTGYETQV